MGSPGSDRARHGGGRVCTAQLAGKLASGGSRARVLAQKGQEACARRGQTGAGFVQCYAGLQGTRHSGATAARRRCAVPGQLFEFKFKFEFNPSTQKEKMHQHECNNKF